MKNLLTTILTLLLLTDLGLACSMYKITKDGKTIVGNNEDWLTPNSQLWFEEGAGNDYSVMYVGFMNNLPQGAINEAGLVSDGFANAWLPVSDVEGKQQVPLAEAFKKVMQTMSTVEEVKSYYERIDLSEMAASQLVFVDASGAYLIVEGDELITGNEPEKTFSNFYYSQVDSLEQVPLPYFQKGMQFQQSTEAAATTRYCGQVMERLSQSDVTATQYSTIYDLQTMTVRLYYYHDFSRYVDLDLAAEFKKGNHRTKMADLFPDDSPGKQFYLKYNNPEDPTRFLSDMIGEGDYSEAQLTQAGIGFVVNMLGYEWMNDLKDYAAAIKVFNYGLELMPNNANLYDSLGEVYFNKGDYKKAKINYEKSLSLNAENENAVRYLEKIKDKSAEN